VKVYITAAKPTFGVNENPQANREYRFQNQFSINCWVELLYRSRSVRSTAKINRTKVFLRNTQGVEDIPLRVRCDMWFSLDGAPPYFAVIVRNCLDENYPYKWIGRNEPVPSCLRRSSDLNPCDFFVWGNMKQLVCTG
jgi:hypothetical protein